MSWMHHFLKARFRHKERPRVDRLAEFIPRGEVVLDVGAHFGYMAKEFCRIHDGTCSVYCFEPVEYTYSILTRVMAGYGNAVLENFALSNREGVEQISIPIKESGNLGIGLSHFGRGVGRDYIVESIRTRTLDDYARAHDLSRVDFIKCDVEGAELLVFNGGAGTLDRFRPTIYTEVQDSFTQRLGYRAHDLFSFLAAKGYRAHVLQDDGEVREVAGYVEDVHDYLFCPGDAS